MIKNESSKKVVLVQHDHNSERFTFELPRLIEGHDMSQCNLVEVHFLNVDATTKEKKSGKYTVTDLRVDGEKAVCSWLISHNATSLVGSLNFLLRFACTTGIVVDYAWNTAIFTGITISDGINAGEMFEDDYVDIIEQWKATVIRDITKDVNANVIEWAEEESGKLRGMLFEETAKTNTAIAVERARIDQMQSGATADDAELVDVRVGADGGVYSTAGGSVRKQFGLIGEKVDELSKICVEQSTNLYNPALQTENTISPHYYVNGVPYESTEFDESYHCTAPIPVEQMTQYTIGIVSEKDYITTAPWGQASSGAFFYDENNNFIEATKETTFTTPVGTKTMRFNYARISGFNISVVNECCMLVKGDTLPDKYSAYQRILIKDRVEWLRDAVNTKAVQYIVDGDEVKVSATYTSNKDVLVTLKKKGGNSIFDFYEFATFEHGKMISELTMDQIEVLQTTVTDWHAPFVIKAINNIDGDTPNSTHFTSGNHEYTNTGDGGTPTARTVFLKIYADNCEITNGVGTCNRLEIKWTNYVQATNTKKADGTGREVLQENHTLSFDGVNWETYVEIIPMESVIVAKWYGLQGCGTNGIYNNIRYIGASNRSITDGNNYSNCGNGVATKVVCWGEAHKMEIEVDPTFDLGDRRFAKGVYDIFAEKYGKIYFNIVNDTSLDANCMYCLRGKYRFTPV
jgi:hypothetical protein